MSDTAFGELSDTVMKIVSQIRNLAQDWEIRSWISTRWLKIWAESFNRTLKTKEELLNTFTSSLLYRLINVDDFGNPSKEEILQIMKIFKDNGIEVSEGV